MKKIDIITIAVLVVCLLAASAVNVYRYTQASETTEPPTNFTTSGGGRLNHFVYLGEDRVLFFRSYEDLSNYAIWIYDRNARGSSDPLPTKEVWGEWTSIDYDHRLVYLGNDRVLDWDTETGGYRIWVYDRSVKGNADPFKGPEVYGTWSTIKIGSGDMHDIALIYLGNDRLLEWHDDDGKWWIWAYDRSVRGNNDPIYSCVASGQWTSITDDGNHQLYYLGGYSVSMPVFGGSATMYHVLDLDQDGNYRLYWYDVNAKDGTDPLKGPETSGQWSTIKSYGGSSMLSTYWEYHFCYLDNDRLLIFDSGNYRIYVIDRNPDGGDPLSGGPEVSGTWSDLT